MRAFDVFQGEVNVGSSPGAALQSGSVADVGDSKMRLGTPGHSGDF